MVTWEEVKVKTSRKVTVLEEKMKKEHHKSYVLSWYVSLIVFTIGVLGALGHYINMPFLNSIHPDWASMKMITSMLFVSCSIVIWFKIRVRLFAAGGIFITAYLTFVSYYYFGLPPSFAPLIDVNPVQSVANVPSLMTIICFGLFALGFLMRMYKKRIGGIIVIISVIPLLGYLFDISFLQYYWPGVSSAMAFTTSLLFLHLGMWLRADHEAQVYQGRV